MINGIIELENLQAGGYITISIFVDNSFAPKSNCWFRITADSENEIAELEESNNMITDILFKTHY
ncbi:CARDB domain-containing protein [Thermodesulfovibrio hydrogeniphilus]